MKYVYMYIVGNEEEEEKNIHNLSNRIEYLDKEKGNECDRWILY